MAQPPDITETFVREVDENLRRDQLRDFFKAYGNWLIAGLILFLAASGGLIWWRQHQTERAEAQVEQLAKIYSDVGAGKTAQAPQQLDQLSDSNSKAVRASAVFARAALALQQAGAAEDREELLEELDRDAAGAGELADRDGRLAALAGELGQRLERVR